MSPKTGLLLVGHGTRSEVGTAQFLALVETIRHRVGHELRVEAAFLELQQPDIDGAVGRLTEQGIERLVTMPLLLFAAGHAKEDVPGAVAAALARRGRSDIEQVQAGHLGCHPAVVELSRMRMEEAVSRPGDRRQGTGDKKVCLLIVGRGSHDQSATAEMYEFAGLLEQALQGEKVEVAFLAMARPLLAEQLPAIARQDYRRVVVQPHLLFCGELVDSIDQQVADARLHFPETEWITTSALADLPGTVSRATDLMEKVIFDRCQEAGIHVVVAGADD
jgi:sirohydrochlorin cobaltochelatase